MKTNRRIASLTRTGYPVATWIFLAACISAATLPASGQSLRDRATHDPVSDGLEVVEMTVVNPASGDAFAEFVLTPRLRIDGNAKVFTIDVGEGVDLSEVARTMVVEAQGHAEAKLPTRGLAKEESTGLRIDTTRSEPAELLAHFAQLHGQEVAVYFVKDGDSQLVQRIRGRVKRLEDVHVTVGDSKIPLNRVIAITLPHSKQHVRVVAAGKLKSIRFRRSVPRWHVAYQLKVKPGAGGDPELTGSASITNPTGHVLENANVILRREDDARFDVRLTRVSLAARAEGSHDAVRLCAQVEARILSGHAFDLNQEKGEARRVVNLFVTTGCDGALPAGKLAVYVDDVLQSQTTLADLLPVQCLPGERKPLGTSTVLHEGEQMIPFASVPGTQIAVTKGSIGKATKLGLNEITGVETWKIEVSNATRSDLDVLFYLKRDAKKEPDQDLFRQTVKSPTTPDLLRKETFHLEFRKPKSGTTEAAPLTVTQQLHLLSKDAIAHVEKRTEDDALKQRLKRLRELQTEVEANQTLQTKAKVRLQAALLHLDHAASARNHAHKQKDVTKLEKELAKAFHRGLELEAKLRSHQAAEE